jgi:hypothetical protein
MDKIVKRCTNWPLWTRFSTVVQQQNLDGVEEALQGFGFDDAYCHLTAFEGQSDPTDILVLASLTYGGTRTDVTLYFGGQSQREDLSPDFMAYLLDRLLPNTEMLSQRAASAQNRTIDTAAAANPTAGPRPRQQLCGRD